MKFLPDYTQYIQYTIIIIYKLCNSWWLEKLTHSGLWIEAALIYINLVYDESIWMHMINLTLIYINRNYKYLIWIEQ